MLTRTSYELGGRVTFPKLTKGIAWKNTKSIEGVLAYARDERTGEYVRVYEVGPEEWVQGIPQSYSSGNFATVETAQRFATKAYNFINRGRK